MHLNEVLFFHGKRDAAGYQKSLRRPGKPSQEKPQYRAERVPLKDPNTHGRRAVLRGSSRTGAVASEPGVAQDSALRLTQECPASPFLQHSSPSSLKKLRRMDPTDRKQMRKNGFAPP